MVLLPYNLKHRIQFNLLIFASISLFLSACDGVGLPESDELIDEITPEFDVASGPIDDGTLELQVPQVAAAVDGARRPHIEGEWSGVAGWPISAIHMALLPTGNILSYGTDSLGTRAAGLTFDTWIPKRGLTPGAHETSLSGTDSNLFCSAQTILPSGNILFAGGDKFLSGSGKTNDGIDDVVLYNADTRSIMNTRPMAFARWYPTITTLGDGRQLVLGGRANRPAQGDFSVGIDVPEIFNPNTNKWQQLTGAKSTRLYGGGNWWYPRAFLKKNGRVIITKRNSRDIYELNVWRGGSVKVVGRFTGDLADYTTPAAMYEPGKVLMITKAGNANIMDINGATPKITPASSLSGPRRWSDATILANGDVFVSGGSRQYQDLNTAVYFGEIWNPKTDTWTRTMASQKARLYHSTTILLPDASVLISGGGPPGPVINMNAEIYYPPYFYNSDGSVAERPVINNMGALGYRSQFNITMSNNKPIAKLSLIRAGSVTHSFDQGQRYMELNFQQSGRNLSVASPRNKSDAPPGLYMVFAIDNAGVPSEAQLTMLR